MTLRDFLTRHDLTHWIDVFDREQIDLVTLSELTEEDLEKLGLPMGARKALHRAIRGGSSGTPRPASPLPGTPAGDSLLAAGTLVAGSGPTPTGIPATIDGYPVESVLGQGGMGAVFRVTDRHTGRPLALKAMRVEMIGGDALRARFQQEYGLLQGLTHPGIVRVFGMGEDPQWGLYYTMELLTGGSLEERVRAGRIDVDQALAWWTQIAEALEAAHASGVLHRDLKPQNVVFRDPATPVVVDWGLGADGPTRSRTGALGTAVWSPPEQAAGQTGPFTDVYGLSAMLLWLLTGEMPTNDPVAIGRFLEDCAAPGTLAEPLARGLAGERRRYTTVADLMSQIAPSENARTTLPGAADVSADEPHQVQNSRGTIPAAPDAGRSSQNRQNGQRAGAGQSTSTRVSKTPSDNTNGQHSQQVGSEHVPHDAPASPWASRRGEDQYGVWAEIDVDGMTTPGLLKKLFGAQPERVSVCQRLRWIAPGHFMMGSPQDEEGRADDEAQHHVTLTRGYWLASTECTQAVWQAVMGNNPSHFTDDPQRAVERVSWDDTQEFLSRLNARIPSLQARLPTEAEWEYAARAGTTGARYGDLDAIAWHGGNSNSTTHPVGRKQPNAWGLYDMIGNVWEWSGDWGGRYPGGSVTDPTGPDSGSSRVYRGGSWGDGAAYCRAAYRSGSGPGRRYGRLGFRLCSPGQ